MPPFLKGVITISNTLENEFLKYAVENGIINLEEVREKIAMEKRKEIIKNHEYSIWHSDDGYWRTYVYDESKPKNRRLVKKKLYSDLEKEIIKVYELQEAKRKAADARQAKIVTIQGNLVDVTLKSLFPDWVKFKTAHTNRTSYIARICADWKKYYAINPAFINKPIKQFTKIELDEWAHKMIKDLNLSKKQYYNMSMILRQELDYAVERGFIESNIFTEVKINTKMFRRVKKKISETQVYMVDEVQMMVEDMLRRYKNDPTDTTPFAVLLDFEIGARAGELVAIKKSDISPDGTRLHIQRQEVRVYEPVDPEGFKMRFVGFEVVEYTKSDDGDREIYLTELARKLIDFVIKVNEKYGYECEDYIFVKGNERINHYGVQARVLRGCQAIGIITKTIHKIRKTYISSLIDGGVNIDEIRRQAGHADERTTYGNYCYNRYTDTETAKNIESALNKNTFGVKNIQYIENRVINSNPFLLEGSA